MRGEVFENIVQKVEDGRIEENAWGQAIQVEDLIAASHSMIAGRTRQRQSCYDHY